MRDKLFNLLGYAGAFVCGYGASVSTEHQAMWIATALVIYCVGMSLTKDHDNA